MDREDEKKFTLSEYNWHIINNLKEFNNKPELIENMYTKAVQYLPDHPILLQFYDYYKTALEYFDNHKEFPNIKWFQVNYTKSARLKVTNNDFSIQVYEDCVKQIDAEIIKKECGLIVKTTNPDISQLRQLTSTISKYCDNAASIPPITKSNIIDMYETYSAEYSGVCTGIGPLDDVIGVMGSKSLAVFGAPSGHGKSTFAISVAFNAAVHQGLCVDYISYEVPKEHIWFNLVSLMSAELGTSELEAGDIKESKLTEAQETLYKECASDLLKAIKASGGYINIIDQTTAAVDSFEGLCARIEGIATERLDGDKKFDRKADLIIIDNVDNLKSSEKDEQTRVNNYIIKFDSFVKQYHHNEGTCMMLLTQLNRGGLQRLNKAEGQTEATEKTKNIDVTVFQKFNALYEKPTCCLVGYADAGLRSSGKMVVYPVKLRNRPVADYAHSKIGGIFESIDGSPSKANTAPMRTAPDVIQANDNTFDIFQDVSNEDFGLDDLP